MADTFDPADENAVNILNVLDIDPLDLAKWVSIHLLDCRIPEPGPNRALSTVYAEITALLARTANRQGQATELYGIVTGALSNSRAAKKLGGEMKGMIEGQITMLSGIQDILYRVIQTLQTQYDAASRLSTAAESAVRRGM